MTAVATTPAFSIALRSDRYGPSRTWRYVTTAATRDEADAICEAAQPNELANGEYSSAAEVLTVERIDDADRSPYADWTSAPGDVYEVACRIAHERLGRLGSPSVSERSAHAAYAGADISPESATDMRDGRMAVAGVGIDADLGAAIEECGYVLLLDDGGDWLWCRRIADGKARRRGVVSDAIAVPREVLAAAASDLDLHAAEVHPRGGEPAVAGDAGDDPLHGLTGEGRC